jgi:CheY-like chemotaxis protein
MRSIADPSRVRQVLVNLMSNAVKFSPEGGRVRVSAKSQGEKVRIEVRDEGAGIHPSHLGRLFQPFSQLASGKAISGGAGLGLSIVRELVEKMRGQVGVETQVGAGSTFWFTLPSAAQETTAAQVRPRESFKPKSLASRSVALVVEDIAEDGRALDDLLSRAGYDVRISPNAEAALRELGTLEPALIVVDLGLPGMPGHVLIPRLREMEKMKAIPIVAITARSISEPERQELQSSGATWVAQKGVMTAAGFLEQLEARKQASSAIPARLRVLVVDDVAANRRVAKEMLSETRFEVVDVASARAALDLLEQESFDVVLMDIQMPEMDGIEATRTIKSRERTRGLPVIAVTAQAMVGDRDRALAAGCIGYVAKPVGRSELIATIDEAVARA